jgi:hypothetical protein
MDQRHHPKANCHSKPPDVAPPQWRNDREVNTLVNSWYCRDRFHAGNAGISRAQRILHS